MRDEGPELVRALVLANYFQFYLQDIDAHDEEMNSDAAAARPAAGWTDSAVDRRIGVEPHSISIGTARRDVVEATLHLHQAVPRGRSADAQHVVEADIEVPTGRLALIGCAEDPHPEHHVAVPPGRYRVRVSYLLAEALTEANIDEPGDHFTYRLDLWPTARTTGTAVLEQGSEAWVY